MSQTPRTTRRRLPMVLAVVAMVALLGTACNQSNTPSEYNDATRANFLDGCTGHGTGTTVAPVNTCECVYDYVVANIPYNDANKKTPTSDQEFPVDSDRYGGKTFTQINDDLAKDPSKLPGGLQDDLTTACGDEGFGTTSTTSGSDEGPIVNTTSTQG